MARMIQNVALYKREQRLRLDPRKKPYWMVLNEGEHLGYYKGQRVGKWVVRYRSPGTKGNYHERTIAEADDYADADAEVILDFKQAQEAARKWFAEIERNDGRVVGPYTVSDALDDYIAGFQGKDLANTKRRINAIIRPDLGSHEVGKLTSKIIKNWLNLQARRPARLRTAKNAEQNYRETPDSDEARRKRKASANRIFTIQ